MEENDFLARLRERLPNWIIRQDSGRDGPLILFADPNNLGAFLKADDSLFNTDIDELVGMLMVGVEGAKRRFQKYGYTFD